MFSYKLQFTCYRYDAVNWKNNLSFKILEWLTLKQFLKKMHFRKNLTDFENRLKTQFNANVNEF